MRDLAIFSSSPFTPQAYTFHIIQSIKEISRLPHLAADTAEDS